MYSLLEYFLHAMINQEVKTCVSQSIVEIIHGSCCRIFDVGQKYSLFFMYYNVKVARRVDEVALSYILPE